MGVAGTAPPASPGITQEAPQHFNYTATKMGMWIFLLTELLLFGGLFILYAVYRHSYPAEFHEAAKELDLRLGLTNTVVLLTSSLTVAMAITALQQGHRRLSIWLVLLTVLFSLVFLVIKYFEWTAKFNHGLYPGSAYLVKHPHGQQMFFGLYFVMTGLHGLHVAIGAIVLGAAAWVVRRRPLATTMRGAAEAGDRDCPAATAPNGRANAHRTAPREYVLLENSGLYWHLVDIVWIFLFPLFYLIT